jgi:DMSO/TMAO reductase YedYZ molybdopterin-dependent catalytic subunit
MALPQVDVRTDIHCVTSWSKLGTSWRGVSLDTLFEDVETTSDFAMARSYGGYTANIPLPDLLEGQAWVAWEFDGEPLQRAHGGPARVTVPHLYFWKSAKWINGIELMHDDLPGFWESNGYHMYGDPWREERYA